MSKYTTAANRPKRHGVTMLEHLEQRRLLSASGFQAETMAEVRDLIKAGTHSPLEALAFVRSGLTAAATDTALPPGVTSGSGQNADSFSIYSAMRNLPGDVSLVDAGVDEIFVTYGDLFSRDANGNLLDDMVAEHRVRDAARTAADSGRKWVVNIEHWETDINQGDEATVRETMDKFLQLIEWAKDERPNVEIGIYRMFPVRDYWTPVNLHNRTNQLNDALNDVPGSSSVSLAQDRVDAEQERYDDWETANQFLQPLADAVDFIVPSLYAFYDNHTSWEVYAEHNLQQAAAYGKPVIPFLMPVYHNTTNTIDQDDFRAQLDFVRDRADSVVIWRGLSAWDSGDGWWQATQQFASDVRLQTNSTPLFDDEPGPILPDDEVPPGELLLDDEEPVQTTNPDETRRAQNSTTLSTSNESPSEESKEQDFNYRVEAHGEDGEHSVAVDILESEDDEVSVSRSA
ncbi:MAG: hypothetical protein AAGI46_06990 [Planctomycetota bacterium]